MTNSTSLLQQISETEDLIKEAIERSGNNWNGNPALEIHERHLSELKKRVKEVIVYTNYPLAHVIF